MKRLEINYYIDEAIGLFSVSVSSYHLLPSGPRNIGGCWEKRSRKFDRIALVGM
jgi:hypothetical protein